MSIAESKCNPPISLFAQSLFDQSDNVSEPEEFRKRTHSMPSITSAHKALKRNLFKSQSYKVFGQEFLILEKAYMYFCFFKMYLKLFED